MEPKPPCPFPVVSPEDDDAVGPEGLPGLQADLHYEVRHLGPLPEGGVLGCQVPVRFLVPPSLPHHPAGERVGLVLLTVTDSMSMGSSACSLA